VVPNRSATTMAELLRNNIADGSFVKSDGHGSYPLAIRMCNETFACGFEHEIVNRTQGFRNDNGTTTNTIEGFLGNLRDYWRERHGVSRELLEQFLDEFRLLKRFISRKRKSTVISPFNLLLTKIFEFN
jgi:hypothetical protein